MSATSSLREVSLSFEPVGSWLFVGLLTAALAVVLLAVPPDRSRVTGTRLTTLVLLRLGAFLALVVCMLRPTFVAVQKARQQGTVLVLLDASESMTVADGPNGRTRWQEMSTAVDAARPTMRELTARGDFEITAWRFDRQIQPITPTPDDPLPLAAWSDVATAEETALGAALEEGIRATAGRTLAGVIVLSDGAQQAYPPRDQPPQTAARRLADTGTPLWSITFGQQRGGGQGRDAAVVNLSVAETVYVKNALEVAGRVRLEGIAGAAVVKLLAETEAGKMTEVDRTTIKSTGTVVEEAVRLAWTPTSLGERKLSLVIEPQEGEVVVANNQLSAFVDVVEGGLRVLYLEGALRVEQRFLRRVLAASPDIQVDFEWLDAGQRARWPVNLGRLVSGDYNVILIGDLDSSALRPEDLRTIVGKVNAGAGLGLLGGFHAFEAGGWGGSALAPLLPFQDDPLARQPFDGPIRESLHLRGPIRMRPDTRFGSVSILRLGTGDEQSLAAWNALPALEGANDLGRLKPTAKPLAVSGDGKPLLVAQEVGEGRVAAFAVDSTWRWVMQGAGEQHRRFWRQFVLWLAKQDGDDSDSLWLRLAQRRISPGTPLEFDAGLTKADGTPQATASLEGTLVSPSGNKRFVRVSRKGDTFGGTVTDCAEPGDWKLIVKTSGDAGAPARERAARFTVFRQDLELANPRSNPLLMRQLAETTTGGVRLPEELPEIFTEIGSRPAAFETSEQWTYTVWDTWPMFLLLAGCLCGEWTLRKRWGLV